jgi:hypothetical protein
LLYCNNVGNSKIYQQLADNWNDDGQAINSQYQTYGIPKTEEAEAKQIGLHRYLATFSTFLVTGNGAFAVSTYPDTPTSQRVVISTPQTIAVTDDYGDLELPINRSGFRFFVKVGMNAIGSRWRLSRVNLSLTKEPFSVTRGING